MKVPTKDVKTYGKGEMLTLKALSFHFVTQILLNKWKDVIWRKFPPVR